MSNLFVFQKMHRIPKKSKLESNNNERGYKLQRLSCILYKLTIGLTSSQSMNDMWIKVRVSVSNHILRLAIYNINKCGFFAVLLIKIKFESYIN